MNMSSHKSENKICQNCKADFTIEPDDFGFYEKIKVPPPTFCPECRRQRRWAWRNNMSLCNRKCDMCEKSVISIYSPNSGIEKIYCNKCWWSDKWDPKSYAMEYDFSRPFFEHFNELMVKVPHMAIVNDDGMASLNCKYTNDWWFSKNCYMCFSGWHVENVMYGFHIVGGRDMVDCANIRSKNEWLYECIIARNCYQLKYSHYTVNCIDSQFLYNCRDCQDCFMCVNLRNKKYCFKNKEYSKEEYEKILESYKLETHSGVTKAWEEYNDFFLKYPRRYVEMLQVVNCTGDIISDSKNLRDSYVGKNSVNCGYSEYFNSNKECFDVVFTSESSECYEGMVTDNSQLNLWGVFSVKNQDVRYTQHCHSSKHLFGCVGLRSAEYSILNKQYTKQEYEKLIPKIIKHMNKTPYVDKGQRIYGYGEFFPTELSPFAYNESSAIETVELSKEEAVEEGYKWQEDLQHTKGKETIQANQIPDSVSEVKDDIPEEVLACEHCNRNYKIVQNELIFYRKMQIPIPRLCFWCRHASRVSRQNPFKLWHRQCMCAGGHSLDNEYKNTTNHIHKGRCKVEFETSYAPDRPEIVYCEKCYQQEVY